MRTIIGIVVTCHAIGGCAVSTRPHALGYGDYVTFSCRELGEEAKRLARAKLSRSEHLLEDAEEQRETTKAQIAAIKKVATEKKC